MPKVTKNFAYSGKTYFVGDEVPAHVAAAVDASYTDKATPLQEKPKAKKTTIEDTLKGE